MLFNGLKQEDLAGSQETWAPVQHLAAVGKLLSEADPQFSQPLNGDNNNSKHELSTSQMPGTIPYIMLFNLHKSLTCVLFLVIYLARSNTVASPLNKLVLFTPNFCSDPLHENIPPCPVSLTEFL